MMRYTQITTPQTTLGEAEIALTTIQITQATRDPDITRTKILGGGSIGKRNRFFVFHLVKND